jgi:phospholipase/lecithinase/hemolysin
MSEHECTEHLYDEIERLRESNFQLRQGAEEQKQRIKRLEEAGDKAILNSYLPDRLAVWRKAKEAKP